MRYLGGKSKISKQLASVMAPYINDKKSYIEPFCGSAKVTEAVAMAVDSDCVIVASDINEYLIELFKAMQSGWIPPKSLSKEEYDYLKQNLDENKALSAFAGFGCSFAGKWFGGYAKCRRGEDFARETHNSLIKQFENLKNVSFEHEDYLDLTPDDSVIYCDPPYNSTTTYKICGKFDSDAFWDRMRLWSDNNIVFISEYKAPDDFVPVWEKPVKTELRNRENNRENRKEKLFVHKNVAKKYGMEMV